MATGIKFCMSSILHRPDSRKTSISPDACMLRKLVRDRNCRPVLRGILESLLHYLTQHLPKWTTRNRNPEKPGLDIAVERSTDWPDQRIEASMKQTQLQTSCTIVQLPVEHKKTQGKTDETSSKIPEKCWPSPQKDSLPSRYGGDQRAGNLISRRITTFQLLQSKFIRSTPKPPITHQREVGTLSCGRGVAGNVNRCQDSENDMHKRNRTRREPGPKRGGGVKDIVAKFAIAEQKEKGVNTLKKQPIKAKLIGRGILLSSLMERFETMATVCEGSDLKCSHERPTGGVKVTSNVKQRVACHERRKDQTVHKQNQHKQIKSKTVGQKLKGIQTTKGQEQRPEQAGDALTKVNSNLEEKNHLKAEQERQMGDQLSDQKAEGHCSLNHEKDGAYDEDVEGWRSGEYDEIQTTVEETSITDKLKYGHLELLSLTSVTERSLPEPYKLFPQVEAQVNWHVATIRTCSPVWSTCVDSSPKQYSVEPSESSQKIPNLKTEVPHSALQQSYRESSPGEPAGTVTDGRRPVKPKTEGLSTYKGRHHAENGAAEDPNPTKAETIQRGLPMYVIPCVYRFDYQQDVDDQTDSSLQSAPETTPPHSDTSMTAFNTALVTCPPNNTKVQTLHITTKRNPTEDKPQEKDREAKEEVMPQSFRLPEDNKAALEDSETFAVMSAKTQPEGEDPKQRPKYTTINYGDPSVKQTYKPKIIRFTDTFTF